MRTSRATSGRVSTPEGVLPLVRFAQSAGLSVPKGPMSARAARVLVPETLKEAAPIGRSLPP